MGPSPARIDPREHNRACDHDRVKDLAPLSRLVGRERECAITSALIADARAGRSGVLVIRGVAGIGKTAVLEHMTAEAADLRILHVVGMELEVELAYSTLQQVCSQLSKFVEGLAPPQRDALRVALGVKAGPPPDRLLVGMAVLTVISAASAERPTLFVVDDAQWIDAASLTTLAFVARRIAVEPLAMVFAARDEGAEDALRGQPELTLAGLTIDDSRALLSSVMAGRLDERVERTILAEAKGNPLALLELHHALTPAEVAGGFGLARAADPHALESSFNSRMHALPPATATLLLIAAAEPSARPEWLWAAAARLGVDPDAAAPAEASGLIVVANGIRFRHPLIRAAIYRSASLTDRRAAHGALAEVISGSSAEDYRAWHRAHSVSAPDDGVASDLEASARRAHQRGGAAAAAAFLAQAAAMSSKPADRAARALASAEAKLDAGLSHAVLPLLAMVEAATDDDFLTARAELVRAKAAFAASRGADAPALLLSAAWRLAQLNPALSRETYLQALTAAILVGRCAAGPEKTPAAVAAAAARDAPSAPESPRAVDLLLDGLIVRLTAGHFEAAPLFQHAIAVYLRELDDGTADPRAHDITHRVCLDVFDIETYNLLAERQLGQLRGEGSLTVLPLALQTCAGIEITLGNFTKAAMQLDESQIITSATHAPLPGCMWAYLAAYRGQERLCRDIVATTISAAEARGEGFDINGALYSVAILHTGMSQYREAFAAASEALQHSDIGMHTHVLNELIEAATLCGETNVAQAASQQLQQEAQACNTSTARGMAARAVALTGTGPDVETAYLDAISAFRSSPFAVYLPRTQLVYGEWLRREGRRADARAQLRIAHDAFTQMGAAGFAGRAARELRATGTPVVDIGPQAVTGLSVQEARIATLAKDGYTNVEIATQLFISPRTVEWHLNRIFVKLDVTSRRQLRTMIFKIS
jgi:DNA-binding CsgD family transcriptional regulator